MHTCFITDGVETKSIIVPDEVGIIMNGRLIKSEFHFIFNQYWVCKKIPEGITKSIPNSNL